MFSCVQEPREIAVSWRGEYKMRIIRKHTGDAKADNKQNVLRALYMIYSSEQLLQRLGSPDVFKAREILDQPNNRYAVCVCVCCVCVCCVCVCVLCVCVCVLARRVREVHVRTLLHHPLNQS